VAQNFSQHTTAYDGFGVVDSSISAGSIFAFPGSGFGCLEESEFVVLGGNLPVDSASILLSGDEDDLELMSDTLRNMENYRLVNLARKIVNQVSPGLLDIDDLIVVDLSVEEQSSIAVDGKFKISYLIELLSEILPEMADELRSLLD
jgi:hypothetical protein